MKNRIWIILLLLLPSTLINAGVFDDRFPSAKALGMGGSSVASSNDLWSAYYNPAGFSRLSGRQIGSAYARPFNVSFLDNFFGAAAIPLSAKYGSVGVSFQYFGTNYEGQNLSGEYTMGLSHGFNLLKDIHSSLAFGYSLKAYYLDFANSVDGLELGSTAAMGVDVGLQASVYSRTWVGVYVLNINNPRVGSDSQRDLPRRIVAGIAYQPYDGVTTTLDINRLLGSEDTEFWAGTEFEVFRYIALRFGGTTNPNRFSAGLGLNIHQFRFDYGMRTHNELGETHLITLAYRF